MASTQKAGDELCGRGSLRSPQRRNRVWASFSDREKVKKVSPGTETKGLLWVGIVNRDHKEILSVTTGDHLLFDLDADPGEPRSLISGAENPSNPLLECVGTISEGLGALERLTSKNLDDETVEQLRALGYIE